MCSQTMEDKIWLYQHLSWKVAVLDGLCTKSMHMQVIYCIKISSLTVSVHFWIQKSLILFFTFVFRGRFLRRVKFSTYTQTQSNLLIKLVLYIIYCASCWLLLSYRGSVSGLFWLLEVRYKSWLYFLEECPKYILSKNLYTIRPS